MRLERFKYPINRVGFIIFLISLFASVISFLTTWDTPYHLGARWINHLLFGREYEWQQPAFKFGLLGIIFGAVLAWNLMRFGAFWPWRLLKTCAVFGSRLMKLCVACARRLMRLNVAVVGSLIRFFKRIILWVGEGSKT